jgi:hypothetical protein
MRATSKASAPLEARCGIEQLRRVDLQPTTARDEQARVRHITLVPGSGAMITVGRRQAAAAG